MKYILFFMFISSTEPGAILTSAEFDTLQACENAARELDQMTRRERMNLTRPEYRCVPKGAPAEKAG